jgi:DNA-binding protein HU-beta
MTKAQQIDAVATTAGITAREARAAIDGVVAVVTAGLLADGKVTLHGLGAFETRRRAPRRVINPVTGQPMELPAKTVVKFKPSSYLRQRIEGDSA